MYRSSTVKQFAQFFRCVIDQLTHLVPYVIPHRGRDLQNVPHYLVRTAQKIILAELAVTVSGYAARMISVQRPRQPILAVSNDAMAARSFNLLSGTEGIYLDIPFSKTSTDHIALCLKALWQQGNLGQEDLILVTAVGYPRSGNRMNLMQTHSIADLVEALGWDSPDNPQVVVAAA
ncbi:MAG: hypothetical protein IH987_01285 [Planctomycetes bacterium]|nr:hypothetical protein [Planctomycetota bacterium]